jgi:hypothetical protein
MARYPSTVMVSIVCPWDEDERLDEAIFRREIQHALTGGFRHLYVFGTAGEGYAVDSARFRRVIEVFGDELAGSDAHPTVGVIGMSTATVVERLAVAHASVSGPSRSRCRAGRSRPTPRSSPTSSRSAALSRIRRSCTTTRRESAAWSTGGSTRTSWTGFPILWPPRR